MKVAGFNNPNLQQVYKKQVDRSPAIDPSGGRRGNPERTERDSVELSANAQLLHNVLQELRAGEDTPAERLDLLRRQVQEDTYEVSLQKLADHLFAEIF